MNPLIPMLAITGKPDCRQIDKILSEYKSVDINQIMLYPRSGCDLEYMGDEWFNTLEYFIERGKEYNFRFWLYDEMNWPSGSCNGMVTANQKYCLKAMTKTNGKIEIVGGNGDWENRKCPDVLCPSAVDLFIENTHNKYKNRFKKYFGKEIIGIFTDEPGYIYQSWFISDDFSVSMPYYQGMKEDFAEKTNGKDLFNEYLNADKTSGWFYEIAIDLLKNRFKDNYLGKIRKFCDENNLLCTGHMFNESPLWSSVECNGNVIEQMGTLSLPGMDDIWTYLTVDKVEWDTLSALKCAISKGQNGGMAELFALGPCNMTLNTHKKMIALCAGNKVDHYFLAVCPVDLKGNIFKDVYFNIFTAIQPWFKGLKNLNNFAKSAVLFAHSNFEKEIAIVYPAKEISKLVGNKEKAEKLSELFEDFLKQLVKNQLPFKLLNNEGDDVCNNGLCNDYYDANSQFTFILDERGIAEKNKGVSFKTWEKAVDYLNKNFEKDVEICDLKGNIYKDMFVKCNKSGDILIVDLNKDRKKAYVTIKYKNHIKKTIINGCMLSNFANISEIKENSIEINNDFSYECCNLTPFRPFFKNINNVKIYCEKDFDVFVALRNYPKKSDLLINGEKLICSDNCVYLPEGMSKFYSQCKTKLKKGENIVCSDDKNEINYLPSMVVFGEFDVEKGNVLKERNSDFAMGKAFYGSSIFSFNSFVPDENNLFLSIEGNEHYFEVFIDNEKLGDSINGLEKFSIPNKLKGKFAHLKIIYYSSIAMVMGNIHDVLEDFESSPDIIYPPVLKWEF